MDDIMNENIKDVIKKMVIEALKNQKVNEQTPPPSQEAEAEKRAVVMPGEFEAEGTPPVTSNPPPPPIMDDDSTPLKEEDLQFESAKDLKEKIAEEKFNKLVKAIAKNKE